MTSHRNMIIKTLLGVRCDNRALLSLVCDDRFMSQVLLEFRGVSAHTHEADLMSQSGANDFGVGYLTRNLVHLYVRRYACFGAFQQAYGKVNTERNRLYEESRPMFCLGLEEDWCHVPLCLHPLWIGRWVLPDCSK